MKKYIHHHLNKVCCCVKKGNPQCPHQVLLGTITTSQPLDIIEIDFFISTAQKDISVYWFIVHYWFYLQGDHPCQSAISIKLQRNFIEIALWHGCSPVNFLHIFKTPFPKNISGWLLLYISMCCQIQKLT